MKPHSKITFIGSSNVGKTSIISSFIHGKPDIMNDTTIGVSFYLHKLSNYDLHLWDTAGQERFRSLTPMYIRESDLIIAIYDVSNPISYRDLINIWIPEVRKSISNPYIYIVESKAELNENVELTKSAETYAEHNGYSFWRVSAKENINIQELFTDIINNLKVKENVNKNIKLMDKSKENFCC
jgi:Ras-related protein Rab-6A